MKKVFEEEAQNIVTINTVPHKNVAGFVALEREVNNTIYYLMPYSEGEELGDYLDRLKEKGHKFSQKEMMALIEPILNGLSHIHGFGVYHKDIKPANIYIRKDDEPILIDFGASVTSADLMTPSYAPIEQVKRVASEYGAYTDLYALGVMMYEMMVGSKPPKSKLRAEVIARGEGDPYVSLLKHKEFRGRFEKHFLKAVDHVLALAYGDRPQTAKVFKEELRGDLKRKKRNRILGFVFLALTFFGALAYALYEQQRDKFAYLIVPNSENAQVLVDNKIVKPQRDGRYNVLLGEHVLEVKNGMNYLSIFKDIVFKNEGEQRKISNPLLKKEVSFEVRTKANILAEVEVNGEFVGMTPYFGKFYYEDLDKKYKIIVKKEGYANASEKLVLYRELMKEDKNQISVVLRKKEGRVEVKSPVGFKVKVNGELIKEKNGRIALTPLSFKRIPGVYNVLLYSSKRYNKVKVYEHLIRTVTVKDKELTLFPQLKAKKSKRYLVAKKREEERSSLKASIPQSKEVLKDVKAPKMGKKFNGVQFATTEVTYDELVRFLNTEKLSDEKLKEYFSVHTNSVARYIKKELLGYYVYKGYENYPVIEISWHGAKAYIAWLNEKTASRYRLPTQSEWEAVATFGFENVVKGNLSVVGTKGVNALGLYDVFGNVAEWGEDDFGEFSKVVLGGSYKTLSDYLSPQMNNGMNAHSHKNSDIGFRIVR
jgi:serine/threonine protein kinase